MTEGHAEYTGGMLSDIAPEPDERLARDLTAGPAAPYTLVLGIAQDAGYPQAGCRRACCERAWHDPSARRHATCLALVDPSSGQRWLIDATPDFKEQLRSLDGALPPRGPAPDLAGVMLTHAHIGHYTGLIHLGRESMDAKDVPIYAMPRMRRFLLDNAPWSELAANGNVVLRALEADQAVQLVSGLSVTPLPVPHRDEASETVAYLIEGQTRSVLYVPDIDDWSSWNRSIERVVREVDVAYVDGTFLDGDELPGRDPGDVPHPTMSDTMDLLADLPDPIRSRVRFLHLNHTNPAIIPGGDAAAQVSGRGYAVADEGERVDL